jgi:hypothetical protein
MAIRDIVIQQSVVLGANLLSKIDKGIVFVIELQVSSSRPLCLPAIVSCSKTSIYKSKFCVLYIHEEGGASKTVER